jgi:IS605 OrfB family transposase
VSKPALTRAATTRVKSARIGGRALPSREVTERVEWLLDITAEIAQDALLAHWDWDGIDSLAAKTTPDGRPRPAKAYKHYTRLWGAPLLDLEVSSRVVRSALELAGRQLRSAAHRMVVTTQLLNEVNPEDCLDAVTGRNMRRRIGKFHDSTGSIPADFFELEPDAPQLPHQLPLGPSDSHYHSIKWVGDDAVLTLKLPKVARPMTRRDWEDVELVLATPPHIQGLKLRAPTLRVVDASVVVDLPVEHPEPPTAPGGRVLGGDWGSRRLMTATVVTPAPGNGHKSFPSTDGRPMFYDPSGLLARAGRQSVIAEKLHKKIAHLEKLLTQRHDPLAAEKLEVLRTEHARVSKARRDLHKDVARGCARWLLEQARAAECSVIALEDLATLEHNNLGRVNNKRVSNALRGQVQTAIEEAAALAGVSLVYVKAYNTSKNCPKCAGKVKHFTAPNSGVEGYPWAQCPGCGHSADRDHLGATNVGIRGAARLAKRVRTKKTPAAELVEREKGPKATPPKGHPTPKRRTKQAGHRAGRGSHPDAAHPAHCSSGPVPEGHSQVRAKVTTSVARVDALLRAHSRWVRATPVLYRRGEVLAGSMKKT